MSVERTYDEREADGRAAVQTALALWLNAWRPLPDLVNWFAVLGWAFCFFATVALAGIAVKRRVQLAQALPEASRIVGIQFASGDHAVPRASTILIWLATIASAFLWVDTLVPQLLRADVVEVSYKTWIILFVGALASRCLEAS